jgi:hypothetical protein
MCVCLSGGTVTEILSNVLIRKFLELIIYDLANDKQGYILDTFV